MEICGWKGTWIRPADMCSGHRQIHILVEEPSAEAALENLLPRICGDQAVNWSIYPFQGKHQLLARLADRLRGYARRVKNEDIRVVVLIDKDQQECHDLKQRLELCAKRAGLSTKSAPEWNGNFAVLNRIAIEELEAWFFGDLGAVRSAYPRVPANLGGKKKFRDPDRISGGTAEALFRVLKRASYFGDYLPKIEVARAISQHMDPAINRSRSFQNFVQGIESLAA